MISISLLLSLENYIIRALPLFLRRDTEMLDIEFPIENQNTDALSLNHSYLCSQILRQLFNDPSIEVLTELTLDIDNGLTPGDAACLDAGLSCYL